jgi:hypothetical protein
MLSGVRVAPRYQSYDFARQTTIFYDFTRFMVAHQAKPRLPSSPRRLVARNLDLEPSDIRANL